MWRIFNESRPTLNLLAQDTLHREFRTALAAYASGGMGGLTLNLLSGGPRQTDSVYDAWALGRFDARYFLLLRRLILELQSSSLIRAIILLSHAGDHPDIFWTKDNWVPQAIQDAILPSYRWSPEEITHMLKVINAEDWGRGTRGQCLDVLLYEDPHIVAKLHMVIDLLLEGNEEELAVRAATLCLTHSSDQQGNWYGLSNDIGSCGIMRGSEK
jgi:hypothetical protein